MYDCLILAGGLGTRLRTVVSEVPKPMAEISGRPFLEWQIDYLKSQGVHRVVLSVGYKSEIIKRHFGNNYNQVSISYSEETTPLGTGGALFKALAHITTDSFYLINGDTFFPIDLKLFNERYAELDFPDLLMATFKANISDRYGALKVDENTGEFLSLESSKSRIGQTANGGVYLFSKRKLEELSYLIHSNTPYSLEDAILPMLKNIKAKAFCKEFNNTLLDIGTPDDYFKANFLLN